MILLQDVKLVTKRQLLAGLSLLGVSMGWTNTADAKTAAPTKADPHEVCTMLH